MTLHKTKGFRLKKKKAGVRQRLRGLGKKKRIGLIAMLAALLCVIVFCCVKIFSVEAEYKLGRDTYTAIETVAVTLPDLSGDSPYLRIDHAKLKTMNGDYIGWLYIPDTKLSYPMVRGSNNDYYLRRSFTGEYLYSGVVFMDFHCEANFSSDNSILYAHNMKDGSMFSLVESYKNQSFWDEHQEIHIYRDGNIYIYAPLAFYVTDMDSDTYTCNFGDSASYTAWLSKMQAQSYYPSSVTLRQSPAAITLSTCVNSDDNSRYVLQAVLVDTVDQQGT